MATAVAVQPQKSIFIGRVQHRDKVLTVPVENALSRNEAKDILGAKYSLVLDVWVGRRTLNRN